MVDELNIVFDLVSQFDGHSIWRVEEDLEVVGAILVVSSNSELSLLVDRLCQPIFSEPDEVRI